MRHARRHGLRWEGGGLLIMVIPHARTPPPPTPRRYQDANIDLCQSGAILRHIGRTYGLYPADPIQAAKVDELMDGVESLTLKYLALIYQDSLVREPSARAAVGLAHTGGRRGGALPGLMTLVHRPVGRRRLPGLRREPRPRLALLHAQ